MFYFKKDYKLFLVFAQYKILIKYLNYKFYKFCIILDFGQLFYASCWTNNIPIFIALIRLSTFLLRFLRICIRFIFLDTGVVACGI